MSSGVQKCLDAFYYFRRSFLNWLIFLSFRIYGLEVTRKDVDAEAYQVNKKSELTLDNANVEELLNVTQICYGEEKTRMADVAEKCQTLLRVASLLLTAFGILLPKYLVFGETWMRIAFFVSAILLLNSVTILLAFFAVRKTTTLSIGQVESTLSGTDLKKSLINDYRNVQADLESRTNYLVDVYRVARFYFLAAFTIFVLLFSWSFISSKPSSEARNLMEGLRNEILFIKGAPGEKGEKGDAAKINEQEIIENLMRTPQFKKAITDILEAQKKTSIQPVTQEAK